MLVGGACTLTCFADMLTVPLELGRGTVVEVAERDFHFDLDVVAAGFAGRVAEVTVAAEESAEEVEGVAAAAALLLAVLETLVAVAVVDGAGLGVGEGFVGFGDLDEFLLGGVVAGVFVRVEFLGELAVGRLELLVCGGFVDTEDLGEPISMMGIGETRKRGGLPCKSLRRKGRR